MSLSFPGFPDLHFHQINCISAFFGLAQCDQTFSSEPAWTILKPAQLASPQFLVLNSKKIPGPRKFILCSNQPNQPPAHAKFCRPRKPRNQPIGLEPAQSGHTDQCYTCKITSRRFLLNLFFEVLPAWPEAHGISYLCI